MRLQERNAKKKEKKREAPKPRRPPAHSAASPAQTPGPTPVFPPADCTRSPLRMLQNGRIMPAPVLIMNYRPTTSIFCVVFYIRFSSSYDLLPHFTCRSSSAVCLRSPIGRPLDRHAKTVFQPSRRVRPPDRVFCRSSVGCIPTFRCIPHFKALFRFVFHPLFHHSDRLESAVFLLLCGAKIFLAFSRKALYF